MIQIIFIIIYFLMGFSLASVFGGREGGTTQGSILSIALAFVIFVSAIISLSIIAIVAVLRRQHDWYAFLAIAFLLFVLGIGTDVLLDIIFISPEEYGERGWSWAVGKYGAWRVLK